MTMQIITDITEYDRRPCAATIGSFDGVHLGHMAMLGELRCAAAAKELPLMRRNGNINENTNLCKM